MSRRCCCCLNLVFPYECLTLAQVLARDIIVSNASGAFSNVLEEGRYKFACARDLSDGGISYCVYAWFSPTCKSFIHLGVYAGTVVTMIAGPGLVCGGDPHTDLGIVAAITEGFFCDGDTVTATMFAGGGWVGEPNSWDFTMVSSDAEPADCEYIPPDEPEEDCAGLNECAEEPGAYLYIGDLPDYDEPRTGYTRHWTLSNLNIGMQLLRSPDIYNYTHWIATGEASGDWSDPGIRIFWDEFDTPGPGGIEFREGYAFVVFEEIHCDAGDGYLRVLNINIQEFVDTDPTPVSPSYSTSYAAIWSSSAGPEIIMFGKIYPCRMSYTFTLWHFENFTDGQDDLGSHYFITATYIGDGLL